MFKLPRRKSSKSGERIDFKFSNLQALLIPRGWDRLFLSLVSVESGKTVAKTAKALVRNGNCQWAETLSESIWISKDASSKEPEDECLFKFIVSMGSSRAGILGEAIINLSSYMSSNVSSPVLLPLKKCNFGTTLQVKIQCLTPRPNISHTSPKHSSVQEKDEDDDNRGHNTNKTLASDSLLVRGGSRLSQSRDLDTDTHQGDQNSKDLIFCSVSSSNDISKSAENLRKEDLFSLDKDLNSKECSSHQRNFEASSESRSPNDNYIYDDCSISSQSYSNSIITVNSRIDLQSSGKESIASSPGNAVSKRLVDDTESTVEELRAEAKMWERNARKLMIDLDTLRSESLDQPKKQADLEIELSAAYAEQSGLKKENEQLKLMLEDSSKKQRAIEDSAFQPEVLTDVQKELESEIKYQQQSNANLSLQLKRSQESNIELVSILQELEQTIEQQKVEIENLSALQLKDTDIDISSVQNLVENENLLHQLQQFQESKRALEKALDEKSNELENERRLDRQSLSNVEREYKYQLCVKDEEIAKLEAQVQKLVSGVIFQDAVQSSGDQYDLTKEIEILREKVQELERDCNELTDENLDLLLKIKDSKNLSIEKHESFSSTKSVSAQSDVSDAEPGMYDPELKVKTVDEEHWAMCETSELFVELLKQLEMAFRHLMKPYPHMSSDVSEKCTVILQNLANLTKKDSSNARTLAESILNYYFELNCLLKDRIDEFERIFKCYEIEIQRRNETIAEAHKNLEGYVLKVQQLDSAKAELEFDFQNLQQELSEKISEMDKLKADFLGREKQTRFHVSAKEGLERRSAELEMAKHKLEDRTVLLEEENLLLQGTMSDMEIKMRQLENEKDFCQSQLKNSKSLAINLQSQIKGLEIEMDANVANLNQKIQDTQAQVLEAQRRYEFLSTENQDLQASALRLTEECNTLQKSNKELQRKEIELHELCKRMMAHLVKLEKGFPDCSRKVEALGENLDSILEAFSLTENSLNSKIDALLLDFRKDQEKFNGQEILANQMHLEMSAEVENLQKVTDSLTKQIHASHLEKEKVESAIREVQLKLEITEKKLITLRTESELQVQSLTSDLAASRQSHEILMVDRKKLMKQLATYRSAEEKLKTEVNNLELKLTVSEYENKQLREENASRKIHFQRVNELQDEVSVLGSEVEECRFEKDKLETSLHQIYRDYEGLKAEKASLAEKILSLQEAMSEHENCKKKEIILEEKLLQMQSDLAAKETLCSQRAHLENEINEVREANKQYQKKICQLELEKSECLLKTQDFQMNQGEKHDCGRKCISIEDTNAHVVEVTRLHGEALQADNKLGIELRSFSSEEKDSDMAYSNKSLVGEQRVITERFARTKTSLEAELRDLRERYLQMSLKYAEVEAEREDLVMKLKSAKSGRRWLI